MKVFISWSGSRSKDLANALRQWLPMVLQYVEPWVSDKDISAGERWAQAIAGELESANFGIICITPENINSEWILFESGALSKSMLDGKVIPLLFGLELSDLSGPLSQFQAQKVEQAGIMEVVRAINKVAEKPASQQIVDQLVPTLWPQLQETLSKIPAIAPSEKHKRPSHEILEELVTGVRGISSRIRDFDPETTDKERNIRRRKTRLHPSLIKEIGFISSEIDDKPTILLFLSGVLREDFPWLSEILTESYREIRFSGPDEIETSFNRLRHMVMHLTHHPVMRELSGYSKESMMLAEELPMILDMAFSSLLDRNTPRRMVNTLAKGK
ncbi:TIR domain-containing protein [Sphingomonas sp. YR710]|uniref:toll/interleukin-1 receptor domain-containing protein n=1 Tax=Sphingomonas sp. YR710 TaxID=1882773 RepID=UPI00088DEA3A|nr:toll/interleukin-1 receptor domain-containing protein [Sphingomonas sp. YR710]SDC93556.1 TIR domain-containing protein [Sphingomonas sp. YR710]